MHDAEFYRQPIRRGAAESSLIAAHKTSETTRNVTRRARTCVPAPNRILQLQSRPTDEEAYGDAGLDGVV